MSTDGILQVPACVCVCVCMCVYRSEGGCLRLGSARLVSRQMKATAISPGPSCGFEVPGGSLRLMTHSWRAGTGGEERNPFPEGVELAQHCLDCVERIHTGGRALPTAPSPARVTRCDGVDRPTLFWNRNEPFKPACQGTSEGSSLYFSPWPVFCSRS